MPRGHHPNSKRAGAENLRRTSDEQRRIASQKGGQRSKNYFDLIRADRQEFLLGTHAPDIEEFDFMSNRQKAAALAKLVSKRTGDAVTPSRVYRILWPPKRGKFKHKRRRRMDRQETR